MVFILTVVVLQSISFTNYALTTTTTNIIYGSAPYLTFDGGRTRVITNSEASEALLRISLSDGRTFTPTTNDSSLDNPIELPVAGQSFNDIGMLIPTDTNSIALSSVIGPPNNYWGDDDGDGQGVSGVTATGSLNLVIQDKFNHRVVARNEVLTICGAPYKLNLSNTYGTLTTRYGVPNESRFNPGYAAYYINPKETTPKICYAEPSYPPGEGTSNTVWERFRGFLPQSVTPSSYGLNFPTTGANNLYFDLRIGGVSQALSWAPVSHGGITATMTDSPGHHYNNYYSVRVTLTGPFATYSQCQSNNPGRIDRPSLPQVFELVGRDSSGNAVVKYGFELKQWFVGCNFSTVSIASSWCNSFGYRRPKVSDLTNATCQGEGSNADCQGAVGATPSSPDNRVRRHIGAGFFTEWGSMSNYRGSAFGSREAEYWTSEQKSDNNKYFLVRSTNGGILTYSDEQEHWDWPGEVVCVYP